MKRLFRICLLAIGLALAVPAVYTPVAAQCPMCRMTGESNLRDGGTHAKGLNKGILYMLATPYLLIGTIGFFWWRNNRRRDERSEK